MQITLLEWAAKVNIKCSLAAYYAKRNRIKGQEWSISRQRWMVSEDAPMPDNLKRGPKMGNALKPGLRTGLANQRTEC